MGGYKQQTQSGGLDSSAGFLIKNPKAPHRTTMPSWDKGELQFRVFPAPCEGGWHPMRESADDSDYGPAIWAERTARRLGVREQLTYCTRIPGAQSNPTEQFVPALHALIKEKPRDVPKDWLEWIEGGHGRGARLPDKIKTSLFFQGAEVMRQDKQLTNAAGQPAPKFPALLMASVSVQMSFESLANRPAPADALAAAVLAKDGIIAPVSTISAATALAQIQGDDDNARAQRDAVYAQAFCAGDWCTINGGRMLRIFQAPPKPNERPHYEVRIGGVMDLSTIADRVRDLWWSWDKLLRYHTAAEQIILLCRAFPAEAVSYVFDNGEYADLLPANVRGAWGRYRSGGVAVVPVAQAVAPQAAPVAAPVAPVAAPVAPVAAPVVPVAAPVAPVAAPAAPVAAPAAPVAAPAAPAAPAGLDLSGGGSVASGNAASPPIMAGGGFGQQPTEFSQAPVATAPPSAPAAPAPAPTGTPAAAVAGGDIDPVALAAAVAELQASRAKAAQATQGQPPADPEVPF